MWLTDLADVARATGLTVIERPGWKTRGHGPMTDVRTITCHHTAGPKTGNYPSLRTVENGRPGLDGPLAQLGLARDGTVYVIAAGLCWHAGVSCDPSYTNSHAIGIEAEGTGTASWPEVQMNAYARLAKALADHYRLPYSRVLGHKETCAPRGRKVDPNFDMGAFRARITALAAPKEDTMAKLDDDDRKWLTQMVRQAVLELGWSYNNPAVTSDDAYQQLQNINKAVIVLRDRLTGPGANAVQR